MQYSLMVNHDSRISVRGAVVYQLRVYILDDFLIQVRDRTTLEQGSDHVAISQFGRLIENFLRGIDHVRGIVDGQAA